MFHTWAHQCNDIGYVLRDQNVGINVFEIVIALQLALAGSLCLQGLRFGLKIKLLRKGTTGIVLMLTTADGGRQLKLCATISHDRN